jgi:hypothetical protein
VSVECYGRCVCEQTAGVLWCLPGCPCHPAEPLGKTIRTFADFLGMMLAPMAVLQSLQPVRVRQGW